MNAYTLTYQTDRTFTVMSPDFHGLLTVAYRLYLAGYTIRSLKRTPLP